MGYRAKVCHVITDLYTGGAEMMLYKLLKGTDNNRFDPVVVSLIKGGPIQEKIEALKIPVFTVGMQRGLPGPLSALQMVSLLRKLNPDLIQGWMYHGNLAAQACALFLSGQRPVIWNIRGSHYNLRNEKFLTAALIWLGGKLSGFPVKIINNSIISGELHTEKLGYRAEKTVIIPNGFDTDLFSPSSKAYVEVRRELGLPLDTTLIGLVGRFHPLKDHNNFLQSAKLLLSTFPALHFIMAGSGIDKDNKVLVQKITDLGISEKIHLLGELRDISKITAALDIAASSSISEGFPNVIGEAMACGVPCVATDVGDSAWIIGETGLVVKPQNPEALARGLAQLISLGKEGRASLGIAARNRIIENFSLHSVVKKYQKLYSDTLETCKIKNN